MHRSWRATDRAYDTQLAVCPSMVKYALAVNDGIIATCHMIPPSTVAPLSQAERHALRKDVTRAQTQLLEAQASNRGAEAAANSSQEERAAMAHALSAARYPSTSSKAAASWTCSNVMQQCRHQQACVVLACCGLPIAPCKWHVELLNVMLHHQPNGSSTPATVYTHSLQQQ